MSKAKWELRVLQKQGGCVEEHIAIFNFDTKPSMEVLQEIKAAAETLHIKHNKYPSGEIVCRLREINESEI